MLTDRRWHLPLFRLLVDQKVLALLGNESSPLLRQKYLNRLSSLRTGINDADAVHAAVGYLESKCYRRIDQHSMPRDESSAGYFEIAIAFLKANPVNGLTTTLKIVAKVKNGDFIPQLHRILCGTLSRANHPIALANAEKLLENLPPQGCWYPIAKMDIIGAYARSDFDRALKMVEELRGDAERNLFDFIEHCARLGLAIEPLVDLADSLNDRCHRNRAFSLIAIERARKSDPAAVEEALNRVDWIEDDPNLLLDTLAVIAGITASKEGTDCIDFALEIADRIQNEGGIDAEMLRIKRLIAFDMIAKECAAKREFIGIERALQLLQDQLENERDTRGRIAVACASRDDFEAVDKALEIASGIVNVSVRERFLADIAGEQGRKRGRESLIKALAIVSSINSPSFSASALLKAIKELRAESLPASNDPGMLLDTYRRLLHS